MVVAEMGNEMSLSEMERNDPSPAEMDGSARTDCPARLLTRFRTAVPCVVKELFWFELLWAFRQNMGLL